MTWNIFLLDVFSCTSFPYTCSPCYAPMPSYPACPSAVPTCPRTVEFNILFIETLFYVLQHNVSIMCFLFTFDILVIYQLWLSAHGRFIQSKCFTLIKTRSFKGNASFVAQDEAVNLITNDTYEIPLVFK